MKFSRSFYLLSENAVFWMILLLLTIGSVTSLYEKSTHRNTTVSTETNERAVSSPVEKKQLALTFDTTGKNEYIRQIADTLEQYDVPATFFVTASWAKHYPKDIEYLVAKGQHLGLYGRSREQGDKAKLQSEIQADCADIELLSNKKITLYRPHSLENRNQADVASDAGYSVIFWDVDTKDWKDYGADSIVKEVLKNSNLADGCVIRLRSSAKYTPEALKDIITCLETLQYELVPVSHLLGQKNAIE